MAEWGIDISNHQAGADLSKAKAAGCSFVFAKATEGLTYRDDHFAGFRAQAKAIGLPFGAYHFARPQAGRTGADEARTFLTVAGKPDGLPHVLDIEDTTLSPQATTAFALEWLATVHRATGVRPIIYTYSAFAAAHLFPSTALASYPLWLANYRTTRPPAPKPWTSWLVWQHTSSATVPGIPGRCDRNQASPAFPPTIAQEDDMPTPDDLIRADVVPSPDGSKDNPTWSLATYIPAIYRNARAAFQQASAARAIAEAQAAKGAALTADEIKAAAKAGAGEALADGLDAHITLTPKES